MAQAWSPPAVTAVTSVPSPTTGVGVLAKVVVPLPSWPRWFLPQQKSAPWAMAQAKPSPTETALTALAKGTERGLGNGTKLPMPSWPKALFPQHDRPPWASTVQVDWVPAETCTGGLQAQLARRKKRPITASHGPRIRISSAICRRNPGGYGGRVFGIVSSFLLVPIPLLAPAP